MNTSMSTKKYGEHNNFAVYSKSIQCELDMETQLNYRMVLQ
jgi:hypothetical protein